MRNRKTVVVAFMLCAVMLLGIGYAALTETLTINGQANFSTSAAESEFKNDVYFVSATPANTEKDTATVLANVDRASFTCNSVTLKGETATFTFVVANESLHDAIVKVKSIAIKDTISDGEDSAEDNDNVFSVTTNIPTEGMALAAANGGTKGTCSFDVTVTLDGIDGKDPTVSVIGQFDIMLDVTTVD